MKKVFALSVFLFLAVAAFVCSGDLVSAQSSTSKVWRPTDSELRVESGGKINMKAGGAIQAAGTPGPVVIAVSTVPASATMTGAEILAAVQTQIANANTVNTQLRAIGVLATPTP